MSLTKRMSWQPVPVYYYPQNQKNMHIDDSALALVRMLTRMPSKYKAKCKKKSRGKTTQAFVLFFASLQPGLNCSVYNGHLGRQWQSCSASAT